MRFDVERTAKPIHFTKDEAMSNQIAIQTLDANLVAFSDKKGNLHSISAEGALFKGGAALASLKDAAMQLALQKAGNGKYRAAVDILAVAFPKVAKAYATLYAGKDAWSNKASFTSFVDACIVAKAPEKGWTKKQAEARMLLSALSKLLNATAVPTAEAVTA